MVLIVRWKKRKRKRKKRRCREKMVPWALMVLWMRPLKLIGDDTAAQGGFGCIRLFLA
jgi:hypothetical protein